MSPSTRLCVVQKFGGTSLGTGERLKMVAAIIRNTLSDHNVIAVVSAMSPLVKKEGTTSLLLKAAEVATSGGDYLTPLEQVKEYHERAIEEAINSQQLKDEALSFIGEQLNRVKQLLQALTIIRELSTRSQDIIMSLGERLSATLLHKVLVDNGMPAKCVDLSGIFEAHSPDKSGIETLQNRVATLCKPENEEVVVATGFVGLIEGGLLNAVGRGYSDFTSSLIAAGLGSAKVKEMQVWKEVDGIFSSDPRIVPTAKHIKHISAAEAAEITFFGAEVLHPMTMERITKANIPIRIKNTFSPDGEGTLIEICSNEVAAPVVAVTGKRGIGACTIQSNRMFEASGFLAEVFRILGEHEVVVDLISTSEVCVSFTAARPDRLKKAIPALEEFGVVEELTGRAILAVVGRGMKNTPEPVAKLFAALARNNITCEMITEAVPGINISCLISEEYLDIALRAVHDAFFAEPVQ